MHRLLPLIALLLAACNLQQGPVPTLPPDTPPDSQIIATPTALDQIPALPTLLPTPTQLIIVTTTPPVAAPTTIDFGGGTGQPTIDAAFADERYAVEVRDGATIGMNYDVTINRGTISMILQGPDGVLWQQTFTASEAGRAEVQITQGGTYEVLVNRENLDGNYAVSWD
jgi:hypothetical protein